MMEFHRGICTFGASLSMVLVSDVTCSTHTLVCEVLEKRIQKTKEYLNTHTEFDWSMILSYLLLLTQI